MVYTERKIGFVFGNGSLPILLLKECPNAICALLGSTPSNIGTNKHQHFKISEISEILSFFKKQGVTHICLAGGVTKPKIDIHLLKFKLIPLLWKLLTLSNRGDNFILTTILSYIKAKGFQIISATDIIPNLLAKTGCFTRVKPNKEALQSIAIARNFLDDISKYDISQACIVENRCITAIEGIEGTANMVTRMMPFNKGEAILVKAAKQGQTLKVDMPTIGIHTIQQCIEAKVIGIALQAECMMFLDKTEALKLANSVGMFIIGIE
ncbi:MAG: DUF1009 family protein [Candidatus Deianiraeaceae bacterium]|jgi:DUF1009 family protein